MEGELSLRLGDKWETCTEVLVTSRMGDSLGDCGFAFEGVGEGKLT